MRDLHIVGRWWPSNFEFNLANRNFCLQSHALHTQHAGSTLIQFYWLNIFSQNLCIAGAHSFKTLSTSNISPRVSCPTISNANCHCNVLRFLTFFLRSQRAYAKRPDSKRPGERFAMSAMPQQEIGNVVHGKKVTTFDFCEFLAAYLLEMLGRPLCSHGV